ncbi:methylated-DNA--[protein]-cysteine S-methyltransferase [Paracrocinitomix mangrovi]|uniref:methylated-DNA--[protein]-cysteine S-methyltransferase n=1 Tax=Paracrocinitomix mangrovi TaxID=2862509 RepID=UPI001EDA05C8|nr:methylated-DNA--[protein]-cysteine S-methyltransferase [Paracrocinitomix mangrovi]UKN02802.1 methylated-DNA--[protein]-cysteine S-methyltransferase [Paracrocinitomix mangrovi]
MSDQTLKHIISTPFGTMIAEMTKNEISALKFVKDTSTVSNDDHPLFGILQFELDEYFLGNLKKFTIPLNPEGTSFQRKVWAKLRSVPFGAKISYMELAEIYGDKKAIRAVAAANGANPIAILIPCHRIIGGNGKLTGYAWGLERKKALLQHEMKFTPQHNLFS